MHDTDHHPRDLFKYNTAATNFSYCFQGCTKLVTIPEGLFDNNLEATNFSSCFYNCTTLTAIPKGLFDNNKKATNFQYCFQDCSLAKLNANIFSLEDIEDNPRFSGKKMDFRYCFSNAGSSQTDVTGTAAPQLWKYATGGKTWDTSNCFTSCKVSSSWGDMDTAAWGIPKQ